MTAYRDGKKWRCTFYYDENGERKKKNKRGFPSKKEALDWEREYILKSSGDKDMLLSSLIDTFFQDMKLRYKPTTYYQRTSVINKWVIPFFKNTKVSELNIALLRKWQNYILEQNLKDNSKNSINLYLKTILDYGKKYLNLPTPVVESTITKVRDLKERTIVTEEQLQILLENEPFEIYKTALKILFWTGIRIGELTALKFEDFDFENKKLKITKTSTRIKKMTIIGTTKTIASNRVIEINDVVVEAVKNLYSKTYDKEERIFQTTNQGFFYRIKKLGKKCGIGEIGVHTFRHSHASFLFNKGVNILLISKRLGHKNVSTTLNTYTHILKEMEWQLLEAIEKK